jgi:hypothetical protein
MNAVDTNVYVYALDADERPNKPRPWSCLIGSRCAEPRQSLSGKLQESS